MAVDVVRESAVAGRVVLWEESARDGAQAKTLMSAGARVRLAVETGRVFGGEGVRHVVFAAGFPAVCAEEYEAVRRVAAEAEGAVSVAAVCRGAVRDVEQAMASVRGSRHARVMVVVPASEAMARVMVHRPAAEALQAGVDLVKRARDLDEEVAVDVCLADASRADHALMGTFAGELTAVGAGLVVLADTVGAQLPDACRQMFTAVGAAAGGETVLASHLHNDLGLGLANSLQALAAGVRVLSSSWLGIAERAGLVATEQLLFLLARHAPELLDGAPWWTDPDLTRLPAIARMVADETGVPLSVTTPIVGTGVGTISTGTPFVHPELFQPYDPQQLLGIEPRAVLTQLASVRVVIAVAARLGHTLDKDQARAAMAWVKRRAFATGRSVTDDAAFADYLEGLSYTTTAGSMP
ncbi:2-isopropylmalate synthase [Streptomyces sp. NBC_01257]|uniref:2-isopropylmalate synthase n=1 Tax=Streptomyces sp. NBC_01257 TaxID=2903799 RepID=UPI002DD99249|nr:2-isopropylmalate synthase [Streptomyces sp. NBC_01257]WRZ62461.1 2-isopropylmalate synthase [Streptomyces sp. NBC_01257]